MNLLAKIKNIQLSPALRSRNYRLFFAGQGISLIGSWMTQVATVWLVYNLNDSPWMLGVVGFTSQIPTLILLPFAGVLIDRWNRHRVIIATQILAMVQSLALAFLALTGVINIWQILILSFCQGAINAFDAPARQAFVPELVEKKEDLANAIAINASMFNGARLIGPAIAGLLIATVGASYCFLIDGLSYIAVIAGLLAMQIKPRTIAATNTKPLERLKEGFVYAFGFPPIRAILLLLALVSLYESVLQVMESLVPEYVASGYVRERSGSVLPGIAPSNVYPTSDGEYLIGANQDTVFARLCTAMSRPELAQDPRYVDHISRGRNQAELDGLIAGWTATLTIAELEALMIEHGVPAGKLFRPQDMLDDPHFQARDAIIEVPNDRWGSVRMQNVFPKLSKTPGSVRSAAPATVGQDNGAIYAEVLGMTAADIVDLKARGVI